MKLFLDSSKIEEAKRWMPVIDGATTNPSILLKDGSDIYEFAKVMYPKPVSVEACGNFESDARKYAKEIPNAVIKVPLLRPDGGNNIKVIDQLFREEILINCTALMSLSQILLALNTRARYVSLFAGRVDDEGGDFYSIIKDATTNLKGNTAYKDWLIIGSIRTVGNVSDAIRAGAHIITIPPAILEKMVKNERSLSTVKEFELANERLKNA